MLAAVAVLLIILSIGVMALAYRKWVELRKGPEAVGMERA